MYVLFFLLLWVGGPAPSAITAPDQPTTTVDTADDKAGDPEQEIQGPFRPRPRPDDPRPEPRRPLKRWLDRWAEAKPFVTFWQLLQAPGKICTLCYVCVFVLLLAAIIGAIGRMFGRRKSS